MREKLALTPQVNASWPIYCKARHNHTTQVSVLLKAVLELYGQQQTREPGQFFHHYHFSRSHSGISSIPHNSHCTPFLVASWGLLCSASISRVPSAFVAPSWFLSSGHNTQLQQNDKQINKQLCFVVEFSVPSSPFPQFFCMEKSCQKQVLESGHSIQHVHLLSFGVLLHFT